MLTYGAMGYAASTSRTSRDGMIDLRSDTVTLPSPAMRKAMAEAEVGDDVFGDDPTVNALEERSAELLGAEAGLLVASGTMGNLVGLIAHVPRGGEIIGPLSEVQVLAIDEMGKGRGSQFEMETLDELIARRYNAGRTTLFATNYSLEPERKSVRTAAPSGYRTTEDAKNAARDVELLRERVGERIYSRLCEMCGFVELPKETPDQRRMRQELDIRPGPPSGGMRGPGR